MRAALIVHWTSVPSFLTQGYSREKVLRLSSVE